MDHIIICLAEQGVTPLLEGVGYYEMTPKTGVMGATIAGNTEIVFYGQGMSHNPASITAIFTNSFLGANQGGAPNQCKKTISNFIIAVKNSH